MESGGNRIVGVEDLIGPALDWAVAMVEGWEPDRPQDGQVKKEGNRYRVCGMERDPNNPADRYAFNPSTDWEHGGPLLTKFRVALIPEIEQSRWLAVSYVEGIYPGGELCTEEDYQSGDTALIAACRAIVSAEGGTMVKIPVELLEDDCPSSSPVLGTVVLERRVP